MSYESKSYENSHENNNFSMKINNQVKELQEVAEMKQSSGHNVNDISLFDNIKSLSTIIDLLNNNHINIYDWFINRISLQIKFGNMLATEATLTIFEEYITSDSYKYSALSSDEVEQHESQLKVIQYLNTSIHLFNQTLYNEISLISMNYRYYEWFLLSI